MSTLDLMELMASWPLITRTENGVMVHTHCLMPSGTTVNVLVQPGTGGVIACDFGAAYKEAISHGVSPTEHERTISQRLKAKGLHLNGGQIVAPQVGLDEAPMAVVLVANAAREIADYLLDAPKPTTREPVASVVSKILRTKYARFVPTANIAVCGKSDKKYTFENALVLPGRKLLFDAVLNNPASINAKTLNNLDIRKRGDPAIIQHIVFDDQEKWTHDQLEILRYGATPVALSEAERAIEKVTA